MATLPRVFPTCIAMPEDEVRDAVRVLLSTARTDVQQGSSFAVTVDRWDGMWNLWLSKVSREFLESEGVIPETSWPTPIG